MLLLEGFNRFHSENLTLSAAVDQERPPNLSMHHLLEHKDQDIKEDEAKIRNRQYMKLTSRGKKSFLVLD